MSELRRLGVDDDGLTVNQKMELKAQTVGLIHFLEEIARRDDNARYRRSARIHADVLRGVYKGKLQLDGDGLITEPNLQITGKPVAIENEVVLEITVKEIK